MGSLPEGGRPFYQESRPRLDVGRFPTLGWVLSGVTDVTPDFVLEAKIIDRLKANKH